MKKYAARYVQYLSLQLHVIQATESMAGQSSETRNLTVRIVTRFSSRVLVMCSVLFIFQRLDYHSLFHMVATTE